MPNDMHNMDIQQADNTAIMQALTDAVKSDDTDAFAKAFAAFAANMQDKVLAEARELADTHDVTILASRGIRQLTGEERKYYQRVTDAMRSSNPMQAFTDLDVVMPTSIINSVFDYLVDNHPLLNLINFQNTAAITEFIVSNYSGSALWGELTAPITSEIGAGFSKFDMGMYKLTAYFPVAKSMLDVGPEFLDRYVRKVLAESVAVALEAAIVDGDGKTKPLGMTRALSGAVDGAYPHKTPITVTSLDPVTIGGILDTLSVAPNNKRRAVPELLFIVNPADYYTKVFPATTVRMVNGSYNKDVLPYPTNIIVSPGVSAGHAVFGLASRYFFGLGSSKGGKIEYSDHVRFLEDDRVYITKLYGNGRPLDENAFIYADISGIKPTNFIVELVEA